MSNLVNLVSEVSILVNLVSKVSICNIRNSLVDESPGQEWGIIPPPDQTVHVQSCAKSVNLVNLVSNLVNFLSNRPNRRPIQGPADR